MSQFRKYGTQHYRRYLLLGWMLLFPFLKTNAQILESYISEAKNNSPKIEVLRKEHKIEVEKINEVGGLPDTKFSGGYFLTPPETRVGPQTVKFSVQQDIPWFGTVSARENYQKTEAEMIPIMLKIAERKLTLNVSKAYYALYALKAKQRITDSIISLLNTYEQLALKALEVDKASAVDVLRLQVRQNELEEQKAVLQSGFDAEKSRFINLLNRKNHSEKLVIPDSLELAAIALRQEQATISANPELMHYHHMKKLVDDSEKLNAKEAGPKLGFGLDYIAVTKRADMDFSDNGKDIVMPMVSVSIPIFTHKYKSVSRQNALKKEKLDAEKSDRKNELQTALDESIQRQKAARITFQTQQKNLEQTRQAERILMKTYETATLDFDDVLDIEALRLKIQMKQIEAVKTYYQQQAQIDYLIK